jgi:hypothetical protein
MRRNLLLAAPVLLLLLIAALSPAAAKARAACTGRCWQYAGPRASPASDVQAIRFVDDRGQEIGGVLQVCVLRGLERKCREVPGAARWAPGEEFDTVTVEAPGHRPVSVRRGSRWGAEPPS